MKRVIGLALVACGSLLIASGVALAVAAAEAEPAAPDCSGAAVATAAPGKFVWKVSAPTVFQAGPRDAIPIAIAVGPVGASNVLVKAQYFSEKATAETLRPIALCLQKDCTGPAPLPLPACTMTAAYLVSTSKEAFPAGDFTGKLLITSDQKPDGDEVTLEIMVTSPCKMVLGGLCLAVGIAISFLITPPPASSKPAGGNRVSNNFKQFLPITMATRSLNTDRAELEIGANNFVERLIDVNPAAMDKTDRINLLHGNVNTLLSGAFSSVSAAEIQRARAQIFVSVASLVIGVNSLVLTNSFGTWKDFFSCVLWGLGAPVGSKVITSLAALATRSA